MPAPETGAPVTPVAEAGEPAPTANGGVPPLIADGVARSLDPRSVDLGQIQGLIAAFVLMATLLPGLLGTLAAAGVRSLSTLLAALAWLAVAGLSIWAAQRWPAVTHRHASYTLDPLGIEIRRGVVWRTVVNVPRSRVQHTDVTQGPLERRFGLGRLVVYTAGSAHAQVTLHGLNHRVALQIRDFLLPREGGDAV
jgi:membrane protein YdbS with pleckstrin-like domain